MLPNIRMVTLKKIYIPAYAEWIVKKKKKKKKKKKMLSRCLI